MASVPCNGKYISRIASTIRQIVILQSLQVIIFISVINFRLLYPLVWLKTIVDKWTSGVCWLSFLLNAVILFGFTVRYSKNYSTNYSLVSSRFEKITKLFSTNSQILILTSIIFGITNSYLHLNLTGLSGISDDEFVNSLESRKCLVICSGPFFALFYFIRRNFKDEIIELPIIHQSVRMQLSTKLKYLIYDAGKLSLRSLPLYLIIYIIFGYKALEFWSILFDAENNFDILYCLEKYIIVYLFTFGTCFYFTLLIIHELFILNLMQPMEFAIDPENNVDNDMLLKDALKSKIPLIRMLAFQDLYILTERVPERRKEIFAITFPGGQGKNWNEISGECKSVLEKFIDGLMKTYPKMTSSKLSVDYNSPRNRRVNLEQLLETVNYRAYPKEVLNEEEVKETEPTFKEIIVKKVTNNPFVAYLFGNSSLLELRRIIAECQVVMWVNLSLTMLLKMSLVEDQYGVTQNDVPKILELMLKLQDSLTLINKIQLYKMLKEKDDLCVTLTTSLEVNIRSCIYILNHIYKPYFPKMQLENDIKEKLSYYNM